MENTDEYKRRIHRMDMANVAIPWVLCLAYDVFCFIDYSLMNRVDVEIAYEMGFTFNSFLMILAIIGILFLLGYPIYAALKWEKMYDDWEAKNSG